jgi:hypothetical protein
MSIDKGFVVIATGFPYASLPSRQGRGGKLNFFSRNGSLRYIEVTTPLK